MSQHPAFKVLLMALLVAGVVVAGPMLWHLGQRSYADFQCVGDLDAQGNCVPSIGAGPGAPTMPASPLAAPGPGAMSVPSPPALQPSGGTPAVAATAPLVPSIAPGLPVTPAGEPAAGAPVDPIALLNVERQRAGVSPLQQNPALTAAAQAHTAYLVQNHQFAHAETPGTPGFLGATPQDRMRIAGYGAGESVGTGEVVATLDGDTGDGVESLMTAIYHRLVMLTPIFQDVGAGVMDNGDGVVITMDMGVRSARLDPNPTLRVVVYPYPAQVQVPYVFIPGHEVPNPMPERGRVGYPISVQVAPHHTLTITTMELHDLATGQVLPGKALEASSDAELKANEWAFIPWDPLRPASRYEVLLGGSVDGQPFNTRWSFDTAAEVPLQATAMQPRLRPGEQTWIRFSKTNSSAWQVAAQSSGSQGVPLRVIRQSWRGLVVEALPTCHLPEGCPVNVTVTDDQAHSSVVTLTVMPSRP